MNRDTRRTRLVLALLLIASITVVTIDFRGGDQSPVESVRDLAAEVVGPIENAATAVVKPVGDFASSVANLGEHEDRIADLEKRNAQLRAQLRTSQLAKTRTAELDGMLGLAGAGRYRIVPAQVIGLRSGQGFAWTATIDVGREDGVQRDMTVMEGDGLVGRVVHASPSTSTVLLAIDGTSAVGVRLEQSLEIGVVSGQGRRSPELELLDPQAQVKPGDRFVTFGSQGNTPYVPGLPVGEVVQLEPPGDLTRSATVRPFVDFTALDLVGVVVAPPRTDPRDSLLPPRPGSGIGSQAAESGARARSQVETGAVPGGGSGGAGTSGGVP